MTGVTDTNIRNEEKRSAIEALAICECNRRTQRVRDAGGASSLFHECLPYAQDSYRKWAENVIDLIVRIRGDSLL